MPRPIRPFFALSIAAATSSFLVACGGGNVAGIVQPKATSAAEALGEDGPAKCRAVASTAEPLVVDWKSSDRVDLEVGMKDGLVVVAYDCKTLHIVRGCKRAGAYKFAAVSRKEDTLQLASADEVQANVPLGLATFGASLKRGSTIDVGVVLVGKRSTIASDVARGELEGKCEGATHVVRAATVGAFAVGTGTRGSARAVAELFGKSVQGSSDASRSSLNKDGDLEACRSSKSDSATPPDQCQSPIRLELVALLDKPAAKPEGPPPAEATVAGANPCPEGASLEKGKCSTTSKGYVCKEGDTTECHAQCEIGNVVSCFREAKSIDFNVRSSGGVMAKGDPKRAEALYDRACASDYLPGCFMKARTGLIFKTDSNGKLVMDDKGANVLRDPAMAMATFRTTCERGHGESCHQLAYYRAAGKFVEASKPDALALYVRGCNLGFAASCAVGSRMYLEQGDAEAQKKGIALLDLSCSAGDDYNCRELANHYLKGDAGPRDEARALVVYEARCKRGGGACRELAKIYESGAMGVAVNPAKARELFAAGCESQGEHKAILCEDAAKAHENPKLGPQDLVKAFGFLKRGCDSEPNGCAAYAKALAQGRGTKKDLKAAVEAVEPACKVNAAYACGTYGELLVAYDKKKGREYLEARCKAGSLQECDILKKNK